MPILGWLIIIVVILMLIYGFVYGSESGSNDAAAESYTVGKLDESNGTFDTPAATALKRINERTAPTPRERVARADIVRFNVLDDTINDEAIAQALADDYAAGFADETIADQAADRLRTLNIVRPTEAAAIMLEDTARAAAAATTAINATRKAEAKRVSKTRIETAARYLRASQVIADDRQNVHDSAANADMRATLNAIGPGGIAPARAIEEARKMLTDAGWQAANPDIDAAAALRSLDMISSALPIGTFNSTEDRIFASVWSRAHHPDNITTADNIRTSIAHALADMNEGGGLVCINGRCGRLIGSLAAVDNDPRVGAIGTFDTYKAKIITESGKIMDNKLAALREKDPAEVARWEAGEDSKISRDLADAISEHVNTYRGRIPDTQLEAIRETCVGAVN